MTDKTEKVTVVRYDWKEGGGSIGGSVAATFALLIIGSSIVFFANNHTPLTNYSVYFPDWIVGCEAAPAYHEPKLLAQLPLTSNPGAWNFYPKFYQTLPGAVLNRVSLEIACCSTTKVLWENQNPDTSPPTRTNSGTFLHVNVDRDLQDVSKTNIRLYLHPQMFHAICDQPSDLIHVAAEFQNGESNFTAKHTITLSIIQESFDYSS